MISRNFDLYIPRSTRHSDDAEGVEEISPGLPDAERATPGIGITRFITFARSAASKASISGLT